MEHIVENNKYDIERLEFLLTILNDDNVTEEILLSVNDEIQELMESLNDSSQ